MANARQFMAARTAAWANISRSKFVEYISGNGNQYVDTGLLISGKYRIEMKAGFDTIPTNDTWLIGDWSYSRCFLFGYYEGLRTRVGNDSSTYSADKSFTKGPHIFKATDTNTFVDDTRGGINWNTLPSTGRKIIIGKSWHVNRSSVKRMFWYVKIFDPRGNLVRDYKPIRFTNEDGKNEGALFDVVSGQIFRNEGSDDFGIGPDL